MSATQSRPTKHFNRRSEAPKSQHQQKSSDDSEFPDTSKIPNFDMIRDFVWDNIPKGSTSTTDITILVALILQIRKNIADARSAAGASKKQTNFADDKPTKTIKDEVLDRFLAQCVSIGIIFGEDTSSELIVDLTLKGYSRSIHHSNRPVSTNTPVPTPAPAKVKVPAPAPAKVKVPALMSVPTHEIHIAQSRAALAQISTSQYEPLFKAKAALDQAIAALAIANAQNHTLLSLPETAQAFVPSPDTTPRGKDGKHKPRPQHKPRFDKSRNKDQFEQPCSSSQ